MDSTLPFPVDNRKTKKQLLKKQEIHSTCSRGVEQDQCDEFDAVSANNVDTPVLFPGHLYECLYFNLCDFM